MVFNSRDCTGNPVASNNKNEIYSDNEENKNYIPGEVAALFHSDTRFNKCFCT